MNAAEKFLILLQNTKKYPKASNKVPQDIKDNFLQYMKSLGIYIKDSPIIQRPKYSWNGINFHAYLRHDDISLSTIIHELAHWLVATPDQRKMYEFGLGLSPDSLYYRYPYKILKNNQKIEEQASILGILIERQLKYNAYDTADYHSWIVHDETFVNDTERTIEQIYTLLLNKKLIDTDMNVLSENFQ